ncbi:MAG: 3-oxoacyl-[acyl-carrier-protein] reductase [Alphaproteobacteria bacterium]|nr:3-oxoacyl-[acyl-carrier-protein] reductase [Alphaproteobacteria bacterium]
MFSLEGRTALVTGASGGIGAAIAKTLAAQGAKVALSGTRMDALEATANEIGGSPAILACNLSDPEATAALAGRAEEALGGLDILVSNAGLTRDGLLMRMKDEDWATVLEVNLGAYFRLTRAALRGMMKRRHGRIIGITSIVGVTGNPGQANYAASKAGMIGFTKALAAEVASRNITANCVAPGFIATAMTDALKDEQKDALVKNIPSGRLGSTADIASAVAYLASDESAYITGQTLHVNGGMAMF